MSDFVVTRAELEARRADLVKMGEDCNDAIRDAQQRILLIQGELSSIDRWILIKTPLPPAPEPVPVLRRGRRAR